MPPLVARPTVVPFVTAWSGETLGPESDLTVLLTPGPRLGYKRPARRIAIPQGLCGRG
ncbi:hypothetical protein [Streptomyces sp. NPDC019937]|uniref:hypothetical protein n=1 Tax=Streptomyces sp. NPDC019937 TaxID=3154787 RepID=UPI0033EF718C